MSNILSSHYHPPDLATTRKNFSKPILVFLSTLITCYLTLRYRIPFGFLSVVTCFVLFQLFFSNLFKKFLERFLGASIAAALSIGILISLHTLPILSGLAGVLITFLFFYGYARRIYDYSMVLGGITFVLIFGFYYFITPASAKELAWYWPLNILIGGLCAVVLFYLSKLCTVFYKFLKILNSHPSSSNSLNFLNFLNFLGSQASTIEDSHSSVLPQSYLASGLISLRITLTLLIIILQNVWMHHASTMIQAIIAGSVITAQLEIKHSHHRFLFRVLGVILGTLIAVALGHIATEMVAPGFWPTFWIACFIIITLTFFSVCTLVFPSTFDYFFLQAGVMLPVVLLSGSHGTLYNTSIGISRAIGSIEGGLIGLVLVYLFQWPIKKIYSRR